MKKIIVNCIWKSTHEVEVPDDFTDTGNLNDFPSEALDEIDSHTAELTDWVVRQ
jgi:hypothetical protein